MPCERSLCSSASLKLVRCSWSGARQWKGNAMLRVIRARLLGLVVGIVIPFVGLVGVGLWSQWRSDEATAIQRALDDARLLAAQVDDLLGNLDNLLIGLSQAVSWDPADTAANDAVLRRA